MRKLALATLMVSLGLVSAATMASATSVSLVVVDGVGAGIDSFTGSSVTATGTGDGTFTVDVQINVDEAGLSTMFMSLEYDTDLGNELNTVGFQEMSWSLVNMMGNTTRQLSQLNGGVNSSQESNGTQEGQLYTFDAYSTGSGPASTSITFARVVFSLNSGNISSDGDDIFSGFFNGSVDGAFDNASPNGNDIGSGITFSNIAVNLVPEPGTLSLLGLGMGALVLSGRRRVRK
ncbi:PEP-CTERM sorting domain-containing protein [Myxococcota bacterium]|nr:PEP-CTERM sorting domain-containing protein [Myxococcota bacterium]